MINFGTKNADPILDMIRIRFICVAVAACASVLEVQACWQSYGLKYHVHRADMIIGGEVIEINVPEKSDSPRIGWAVIKISDHVYDRRNLYGCLGEITIPMPFSHKSTDEELQHKKGDRAYWILQWHGNVPIQSHPEQKLDISKENRRRLVECVESIPAELEHVQELQQLQQR